MNAKACKEVHEIIKCLSEEDRKLIPKKIINLIEKNMDKEYTYKLKEDIEFENQEMMRETRKILAVIYIDYLSSKEEREIINSKFREDIKKEEKKSKIEYKNFLNKDPQYDEKTTEKIQKEMILLEEKWYKKLLKKILEFIRK